MGMASVCNQLAEREDLASISNADFCPRFPHRPFEEPAVSDQRAKLYYLFPKLHSRKDRLPGKGMIRIVVFTQSLKEQV